MILTSSARQTAFFRPPLMRKAKSGVLMMTCSRDKLWNCPARLINRQWGFAAEWVTLELAIEQFEAHDPDLQEGIDLEWVRSGKSALRLTPPEIRALARKRLDLAA